MPFVERRFRPLFLALLACFAMFGVCITIIGATLPRIIAEFGWSYLATGVVLSTGAVGYFLSAFASGMLIDRIGPKRLVVGGLVLQAVGLAFFAFVPDTLVNMLFYFLVGVGQGGLEVGINYAVVRMERGGRSRLMTLMHAVFCLGAVCGPFGVVALLSVWQVAYRLMAVAALVLAGALALVSFAGLKEDGAERGDRPPVTRLLKRPLLILLFLTLLLYVGTELGVSAWVAEYYVTILGTSVSTGALMVAVFWAGLLLGRVALSLAYHGDRQAEPILILAVICTVGLCAAVSFTSPLLAGIGFFVSGLGYSAIYPLVMVLAGKHFPQNQGVAVGFVSAGGGAGSFSVPFLMAVVANRFGLRAGFFLYICLNVIMVLVACAMIWRVRIIQQRAKRTLDGARAA